MSKNISFRRVVKGIPGVLPIYYFFKNYIVDTLNSIQTRLTQIDVDSLNQQLQRGIITQYKTALLAGIKPYENIADAGFRCYSQFEEDGIILYILTAIGIKNRTVVEICCGSGDECMATNLILNHGFKGYLFDGDSDHISAAKVFFENKKDCYLYKPNLVQAWITKDNINKLLEEASVSGEVDLLSLDIDGNDYYVWEAISLINPRLCVFETHNIIPGDLSVTIPYDENFLFTNADGHDQEFRSASLLAMQKLSAKKGYRLIGGHRHGFNVFFLRNDLGSSTFPEVSISEVHDNYWTIFSQQTRWPHVKSKEWESV